MGEILSSNPPCGDDELHPETMDNVPMPALSPGTRLGVYEVLEPIGSGGMGEVYRARDTEIPSRPS